MSQVPLRVTTMVSAKWLADKLATNCPNFRVLDGSWHMPFTKRSGRQEFNNNHIPGAQFFDIDECCDKNSPYDHMLPSPEVFSEYVGKLGISNKTHVVVYDNNDTFGMMSAPRVWWAFRVYGHNLVSVLDGGLPRWQNEHFDTTDEIKFAPPVTFKAVLNPSLIKSFEDVETNIEKKEFTVMDARPTGRFNGTAPEPRPGIKSGHIPNSINIPFTKIMDPERKVMRTEEDLKELFQSSGLKMNQPVVASCGSGVSACVLALGAYVSGKTDVAVYDGSWAEWYKRARNEHKITSE